MKNRRTLQLTSFVCLLGISVAAAAFWWGDDKKEQVVPDAATVQWPELVPEGFEPFDPLADMTQEDIEKLFDGTDESNALLAELDEKARYAPTVPELDGQQVRIAGYVVPLDFDNQTTLGEFLLVPYYGACIHTPPPPPNQVVHAFAQTPVELESTWDPVWAIGTINTETVTSDLAESGYRMTIEAVVPWSEDDKANQ